MLSKSRSIWHLDCLLIATSLFLGFASTGSPRAWTQSVPDSAHQTVPRPDNNDFTIILLPDTQYYSESWPEVFESQTRWIVDNKDARNIVFVSQLGDLVQNYDDRKIEWQRANEAMCLLDGVVPYGIALGNHDMQGPDDAKVGATTPGTAEFFNRYFPASRYESQPWWGGSFQTHVTSLPQGVTIGNKNNYQLFSAGGDDYIFLHIEWCPPDQVLEWANGVLASHKNRKALVSTHGFIDSYGSREWSCHNSEGTNNGQAIWKKLIANSANVFFVFNGHFGENSGTARRSDEVNGRTVHQLLSDYQWRNRNMYDRFFRGGDGFLRILTFRPDQDVVDVTTYSPYLDEYLSDPSNQFRLSFTMSGTEPDPLPTTEFSQFNQMADRQNYCEAPFIPFRNYLPLMSKTGQ